MDRLEGTSVRRDQLTQSIASFLADEGMDPADARDEAREMVNDAAATAKGRLERFGRKWWTFALRGVLAIVIGALFLARPLQALATLVLVLGAWVFVDGVIALVGAIAQRRSWYMAFEGALGILIGYLVLTRPASAAVVFLVLAAVWAMARGVNEIAFGTSMRYGSPGRMGTVVLGILSFMFGLLLLFAPFLGALVLGYWLGFYAVAFGVLLIIVAFQIRGARRGIQQAAQRLGGAHPQPV